MKDYKIQSLENYKSSARYPVSLVNYLITNNEDNEKFAVFKLVNNYVRNLTGLSFIIEEYNCNDDLIISQELRYQYIDIFPNDEFSPFRKLKLHPYCDHIKFKLTEANFNRLKWNDGNWFYNQKNNESYKKYKSEVNNFESQTYYKNHKLKNSKLSLVFSLFLILICAGFMFVMIDKDHDKLSGESVVEQFKYEIVYGGIEINDYIGNSSKIVIPNYIKDRKVLALNGAFLQNQKIVSLTILGSINLNNFTMEGNKYLKNVTCDDITKIGTNCFKDCISLETFTAKNISYIETGTFDGCNNLTTINAKEIELINSNSIKDCEHLKHLNFTFVNEILPFGINNCPNITEINFNVNNTYVDSFNNLPALKYIDMPQTKLYDKTFTRCNNITEINFKDTPAKELGSIFGLTNDVLNMTLRKVTTAKTFINRDFFKSLHRLEALAFDMEQCYFEYPALSDCTLLECKDTGKFEILNDCLISAKPGYKDIKIPEGVKFIADNIFRNQEENIITLSLNNQNVSISNRLLNGLRALQKLDLGENGKIKGGQLESNGHLTHLRISLSSNSLFSYIGDKYNLRNIELIGYGFISKDYFKDMSRLENIDIAETITGAERDAFKPCTNIKTLSMPCIGNLDVLGVNKHLNELTIKYSDDNKNIPEYFCEGYYNLTSLTVEEGFTSLSKLLVENCGDLKTIVIPNSVKRITCPLIGTGCGFLRNVTIPFIGKSEVLPVSYSSFNYSYEATENLTITGPTYLSQDVFSNAMPVLKSLDFKMHITGNPISAFHNLTNLRYLGITGLPINEIGELFSTEEFGFKYYSVPESLTTILVKDSYKVPRINNCQNIKNLIVLNCRRFDERMFDGCSNLKNFYVDDSSQIDSWLYYKLSTNVVGRVNVIKNDGRNNHSASNVKVYPNLSYSKTQYTITYLNRTYTLPGLVIENEQKILDLLDIKNAKINAYSGFDKIEFPFIDPLHREIRVEVEY